LFDDGLRESSQPAWLTNESYETKILPLLCNIRFHDQRCTACFKDLRSRDPNGAIAAAPAPLAAVGRTTSSFGQLISEQADG
jgi:hypothetical protein